LPALARQPSRVSNGLQASSSFRKSSEPAAAHCGAGFVRRRGRALHQENEVEKRTPEMQKTSRAINYAYMSLQAIWVLGLDGVVTSNDFPSGLQPSQAPRHHHRSPLRPSASACSKLRTHRQNPCQCRCQAQLRGPAVSNKIEGLGSTCEAGILSASRVYRPTNLHAFSAPAQLRQRLFGLASLFRAGPSQSSWGSLRDFPPRLSPIIPVAWLSLYIVPAGKR
jgi:hypothetical protein